MASNSPKVTEWLLDRSADVNAKAHYGETPLSIAVSLGSESIVRMLLERNADPNSSIDGHSVLVTSFHFLPPSLSLLSH